MDGWIYASIHMCTNVRLYARMYAHPPLPHPSLSLFLSLLFSSSVILFVRLRHWLPVHYVPTYRLVGLVVKASASRAEDPGFESLL